MGVEEAVWVNGGSSGVASGETVVPLFGDAHIDETAPVPARRARRRGWLVRRMLVVADVVGLTLAFLVVGLTGAGLDRSTIVAAVVSLPVWIAIARLYHLYDQDEERTHHATADDIVGVFHLVTIGTWLMFASLELTGLADPTVTNAVVLWGSAIVFITLARAIARALCRRSSLYEQNTLILGAGDIGQRVARKLLRHPEYGLNLVGFVDAQPKPRHDDLTGLPLLGAPDDLAAIVNEHGVERVIVAFSGDAGGGDARRASRLNDLEIQVDVVPRLFELVGPSVKIDTLEGLPLVELPPARLPRSSQMIKRTIDARRRVRPADLALARVPAHRARASSSTLPGRSSFARHDSAGEAAVHRAQVPDDERRHRRRSIARTSRRR